MKRSVGRRLGGASILTLLVAVSLLLMEGMALADITVSLYLEIHTGLSGDWEPTAPGPSGVAYNADNNTMFVVDTDRNNYAEFEDDGINIWEITLTGSIVRTGALPFNEPTGVSYDPGSDRLYVSSDSDAAVYEMTWGAGDPFVLREIGIPGGDTEDPVFDPGSGDLFVLEGSGEINRVDLHVGNVLSNPISLDGLGPTNWEGLTITPAGELLVGAENGTEIHVLSTAGAPQQVISMTQIGLDRISGLGISIPGAGGDGYDIWVADRQDTGSQHGTAQNDGKLWRLSTDGTPPPPTTTTTTLATTTTTAGTTTTTQATTTTTAPTTTTTQATTTTTAQSTTTTTIPGSTTTTTILNPPPPPDPDDPFTDDNGSVFENSIEWLAKEGITQGCNPPANTRFCPDDPVTRGQMAAFLVRANGYSTVGNDYFTDDEGSVFENAINRLRTAGVTQGCNPPANTRYCPSDLVTRGQMAAFLVRAFDLPAYNGPDRFRDDNASVFEGAIERLAQAGVTLGCNPPTNDRFCPNDFVTRGQMAAFLKRALGE